MPCTPAKARHLLRTDRAKVVRVCPFTIKLLFEVENIVQTVVGGLDVGSKKVGCAAIGNGETLYAAEICLRQDVGKKMTRRKMYRRTRRGRKTRYRQPRWLNRGGVMRKEGRIAPSLVSKIDSHLREMRFVESILPISHWRVEIAQFDIHLIVNPDVNGESYQNGCQKGFENVKMYVKWRDGYECKSGRRCKHSKVLRVHHILERHEIGANAPENLITLCDSCHKDLHDKLFELKKVNKRASKTRHATHVNIITSQIGKICDFVQTYGYETKFKRENVLKLCKTHYNDAIAICCTDNGETVAPPPPTAVFYKRHVSAGDYQKTKGKRSEKIIPTGKLFGLRKHDLVKTTKGTGFVSGKRSSGQFALENIFGEVLTASVNIKKGALRLCARSTTLCSPCLKAGVS